MRGEKKGKLKSLLSEQERNWRSECFGAGQHVGHRQRLLAIAAVVPFRRLPAADGWNGCRPGHASGGVEVAAPMGGRHAGH